MTDTSKRKIAIVGGGPAGLMAAERLSLNARNVVTIYDAMPTVGRKFLMAGRGGLNLTHSEALKKFMARYGSRAGALAAAVKALPPDDLRAWCEGLGQPTFVGTSGRVFPKAMKASGLLRAWLRRLAGHDVALQVQHRWTGWDDAGQLVFSTPGGRHVVEADATVLALGGASWPRLGSNGGWVVPLRVAGVSVEPLLPANCGFHVVWSDVFRKRFEGHPLKAIALNHGGERVRGEAIITAKGIEGGGVYATSARLRDTVLAHGSAILCIDLKPDVTPDVLARRLAQPRAQQSMATFLRKSVSLTPAGIGLVQEKAHRSGVPLGSMTPDALAGMIKEVALHVTGVSGLERAISSAGGIAFDEIDERFMLVKKPGVFVAGEMLDWEAPTGGYLLQACFAMGLAAGRGANDWLDCR